MIGFALLVAGLFLYTVIGAVVSVEVAAGCGTQWVMVLIVLWAFGGVAILMLLGS